MNRERINKEFNKPVESGRNVVLAPSIVSSGGLKIRIQKFEQTDDSISLTIYIEELEKDNLSVTLGGNKVILSLGVNKTYRMNSNNSGSLLKLNTSYYVLHRAEIALPFPGIRIENYVNYHDNKNLVLNLKKE